ncbi:glutamate-rich protein 3 isoform X2 [Heterocephalus glaber]|uniref:Glutamate-rich protein 3 isoform X2 n=1 Tax=Heterocephalus glaber TaxID=10181 RepID=A0AAX6QSA3_HETGA|nr:glutamate-rich protein 3 isoform X2 [Heterocephalus glaber]
MAFRCSCPCSSPAVTISVSFPGAQQEARRPQLCACVCLCVCVCVCSRVCVCRLRCLGNPRPRATQRGQGWVSSHTAAQKSRWKLASFYGFPGLSSSRASAPARTPAQPQLLPWQPAAVDPGARPQREATRRTCRDPKRDPAKMSLSHPAGLLAAYNSLTDKHLVGYFNNTRIRRHLLRSGLITRSGRILSEKEYRLNIMKRDHQKYIRECLAQAIFHKVLDMERYHQLEIKRKLETLARKERFQRFKGENTRQSVENKMPILSPHPPLGSRANRGHNILVNEGHSSPLTLGMKAMKKFRSSTEKSQKINPYQLQNIDSYMMPIPPPLPPPNGKIIRQSKLETWRRRRLCPTTAPNGLEPLFTGDSGKIYKTSLHSNAAITMIYLGKNVHLSYDGPDFRDEIRVYQQHCGGENLCVYKGKLLEKETFQFISKRHHGFPFSLTFFLNGMQVNRLSSCCEYKHRKGSRLGGKRGYFGFVCVERASPCYKCIIAMGLDKKPSSVKPRKENSPDDREDPRKGERKLRQERANWIPRRTETEGKKISASAIFSVEEIKPEVREVRTAMEEMERKGKPGQDVWEDNQEYEEDFEVDEEKQDEKTNEEGQADDQMNGISKSPSEDEKDNLGPERESEISAQKAPDADANEKDEDGGCSDSELEEDKQDTRSASSASSRSHPYSSDSEDDSGDRGREARAEPSTDEGSRSLSSVELSENDEPSKPHLPIEESFETEPEDQEIRKADVEIKPLPTEESRRNILDEEMERGTHGMAENLSEKSRKHACEEEKQKDKSELWEGSTAKVEDRQAGLPGGDRGVGQIISETLVPGCHSHYEAQPGDGSSDDWGTPGRKLEIDMCGAPNRNLVMEKRAALNSNKKPNQITQETHYLDKEAPEGDEGPQHQDAELMEDRRDAAQLEEAGVAEFPSGEWKPTAEQPALAEQLTEPRETPVGLASGAEAEEDENGRLGREELDLTGKAAARESMSLSGEAAPEERALRQTEKAASPTGEQGSGEPVLPNSFRHRQEVVTLRGAATPGMGEAENQEAVREAASQRPDADGGEEEAPTELEDVGAVEDAPSLKEDGLEEATTGGQKADKEATEALEAETPSSSSTAGPAAEASCMGTANGSLEDLPQEATVREETVPELGPDGKEGRKETLRELLGVARERGKPGSPPASLREAGSEKKVVTWADAPKAEDTGEEEQKRKVEERKKTKEIRSEEQAKAPRNETESDGEAVDPTEATGLTEGTRLPEDSQRERVVNLLEATLEFEKSPEKVTALRRGKGGEGLSEAGDTEHKGWAEWEGQATRVPSKREKGPGYGREGPSEGPGSEPPSERRVPDLTVPDTAQAEECAALRQDGLAGPEGRREEGAPQGPEGVQAMTVTPEAVPEGDPRRAKKFSEEAEPEDPEEEGAPKSTLETEVMKHSSTEREGATGGETEMAGEDLQEGGVEGTEAERKEVLADLRTAEGKAVANSAASYSGVAGEEARLQGDKAPGKTAASERVVAEEMVSSRGEVTVAPIAQAEAGVLPGPSRGEGEALRLGQDGEGGEAGVTLPAGSAQAGEAGPGSRDPGQVAGTGEESSQEGESEPSKGSLEAVAMLPGKSRRITSGDFSGTQEKQERMVQRQSENADVP